MPIDMNPSPKPPQPDSSLPRIFVREPGWRVSLKVGSEKVYCYQITPGEEAYHRLLDGEVYVFHGEEKLCLPCAARRGLIVFEARPLREQMAGLDVAPASDSWEYELS